MRFPRLRAPAVFGALLTLALSTSAFAQTTTWDGSDGSSWNDPDNWSAGVPNATTSAIIADVATQPSSYTGAPACLNLTIQAGAEMTLGAGFDLTVDGDFTNAGTFTVASSSSDIDVLGDWVDNGTFVHGGAAVTLDGTGTLGGTGNTAFNELVVTGGTRTVNSDFSVAGDITIEGSTTLALGTRTVTVSGNWVSSASGASVTGAGADSGVVEFDASGFFTTGSNSVPNVVVSGGVRTVNTSTILHNLDMTGVSSEIEIQDDATLTVNGAIDLAAGTLDFNGTSAGLETIDCAGACTISAAAGTTSADTLIQVDGAWTSSSAFAPALGLVELRGGVSSIGGATPNFPSLRIVTGTRSITADVTLAGDLTVDAGAVLSLTSGDVDAAGAVTINGVLNLNARTIAADGNWTSNAGSATVTGSGTVELSGTGSFVTGTKTVPNVDVTGGTRTVSTSRITGDLTMAAAGATIVLADNQTLTVDTDVDITAGTLTFASSTAGNETLDVGGACTIQATSGGTTASTLVQVAGAWSSTSAWAPTSGLVQLDGGSSSVGGTAPVFFDLQVVSGTKTVTTAATINGNLTVDDGATLDTDASLDVNGEVTLGDATAAWDIGAVTHTVAGDFESNGADADGAATGTIEFDGTGSFAMLALGQFLDVPNVVVTSGTRTMFEIDITNDLTMNGGGITLPPNSDVNVGGDCTFTAGTLSFDAAQPGTLDVEGNCDIDASTGTMGANSRIECAGDWLATATFAPTAGAVVLDGGTAADVDGVNFHNVTAASGSKSFVSGATVNGNLSISSGATMSTVAALDIAGNVIIGTAGSDWDLGNAVHTVAGSWQSSGGSATTAGTGAIRFDGAGSMSTGGGTIANVEIVTGGVRTGSNTTITDALTMTAGSLEILDDQTVAVGGDATLSGGTLSWTASVAGTVEALDVEGNATVTCAAGTTTANSRLRVAGDWSSSAAFSPAAGVVVLDGAGATAIGGASPTFFDLDVSAGTKTNNTALAVQNDLTLGAGAALVSNAAVDVNGDVTLGATGSWDLGAALTHTVAGSWTSTGASATSGGTGRVDFDGTGTTSTGGGAIHRVRVSNGTRTMQTTAVTADLELDGASATIQIGNDHVVSVGTDANLTTGTLSFFGAAAGVEDVLDVAGNCTVTATAGAGSTLARLRVAGDWVSTSAWSPTSGRVELDGGTTTTIGGADPTFFDLTVVDGDRSTLLGSPVAVGNDLTVTSGTLTLADVVDVAGDVFVDGGTLDLASNQITVVGTWDSDGVGATVSGPGTIELTGLGDLRTGVNTIPDVVVSGGDRSAFTAAIAGNLDVNGVGTIFDVQNDQTVSVSGTATLSAPATLQFTDSGGGLETLDVEGDCTVSASAGTTSTNSRFHCAGVWDSTSAFLPANGRVVLDGGTTTTFGGTAPNLATLQIVDGTKTGTTAVVLSGDLLVDTGALLVTTAATLSVGDDVTLGASGSWDLGALTHPVVGDWTSSGADAIGLGAIDFTGTGTTTGGGGSIPNMIVSGGVRLVRTVDVVGDVDATGGTFRVANDALITIGGTCDMLSPAIVEFFSTVTGTVDVIDAAGDVTITASSGVSSTNARFRCAGNWSSGAAFALPSGVVELDGGTSTTIAGAGTTFPDLRIVSGTKNNTVPVTVAGDLVVDTGAVLDSDGVVTVGSDVTLGSSGSWDISTLTHSVAGSWTSTGASTTGGGTITFTGPGSLATGGGSIDNVTVNSTGTRSVSTTDVLGNFSKIGSGTLNIQDNATLTIGGNASFTAGTLGFVAGLPGNELIDIAGNCTLTAADGTTSSTSRIECAGNWSANGNFSPANGTVSLDGVPLTLVTGLAPNFTVAFENLVVTNGVREVSNDIELVFDTLVIDSGAELRLDDQRVAVPGSTITCNGLLSIGPGGDLSLGAAAVVAINLSGTLSLVGDPDDVAAVTGEDGGGYFMSINGTIEAGHFLFQEMGSSGIIITSAATIGAFPNDLRGGTFDCGAAGGTLLDISRSVATEIRWVDFEDTCGDGPDNVRSIVPGATVTFVNSGGALTGPGFENDPLNQIAWSSSMTNIVDFTATAGVDQVTLDWETFIEVDAQDFVMFRATNFGGPFTNIGEVAAQGAPPNSVYQIVDNTVLGGQFYVYQLFERLTHGALRFIAQRTATPFSSGLPANIFDVGASSTYATIQDAIDASGGLNPVVMIEPGTYDAFTITPGSFLGTLRVYGDGTGAVIVDTTTQPVQILNLSASDSVDLRDLQIGDVGSPNEAITVQNCVGVVVLDTLDITGGSGQPGCRVNNSDRTTLQRCDTAGSPGLLVEGGSTALAGGGTLDALEATGASSVRTAGLTGFTTNIIGGSTHTDYTGVHTNIDAPTFQPLNQQFFLTISGEPNGLWFLIVGFNFSWLDLSGSYWEMVGIANLNPLGVLAQGPFFPPASGSITFGATLIPDASLLGLPIIIQPLVVNVAGNSHRRWGNVSTIIGMPQ